jgi:hypothetical protein
MNEPKQINSPAPSRITSCIARTPSDKVHVAGPGARGTQHCTRCNKSLHSPGRAPWDSDHGGYVYWNVGAFVLARKSGRRVLTPEQAAEFPSCGRGSRQEAVHGFPDTSQAVRPQAPAGVDLAAERVKKWLDRRREYSDYTVVYGLGIGDLRLLVRVAEDALRAGDL